MPSITGCHIGSIILLAGGEQYTCTACSLHMSLNNIPSATVVVGCGKLVTEPAVNVPSAEDLLNQVLARRSKAYLDMVECTIAEVMDTYSRIIFKGVIVTGYVMYKTGNPTSRLIKFQCMNSACKLYVAPLVAHRNICGASIVKYMNDTDAYAKEMIDKNSFLYSMGSNLDTSELTSKVLENNQGQTLDKYVADIANQIVAADAETATGDAEGIDFTHITDYLYSDYKINTDTLAAASEEEFVQTVADGLLQLLQRGSIYDSLQNILLSDEFMLSLVPRWSDNAFKLEIAPITAWTTKDGLSLSAEQVLEIDSVYKPLVCLNTPEAFIVHFSPLEELIRQASQQQQIDPSGVNGVFSINPDLEQRLKERFQSGGKSPIEQKTIDERLFKLRYYTAPKWLYNAFMSTTTDGQSRTPTAADKHTTETNQPGAEKNTLEKAKEAIPCPDVEKERELADLLAKALFNHLFGAGDTAYVTVVPSLRFQDFERHIGNTLDIVFNTGTWLSPSPLNIRGMLSAVHYEYSVGKAGTVRYTLELSRVRPLDEDEQDIESPIYKRVN